MGMLSKYFKLLVISFLIFTCLSKQVFANETVASAPSKILVGMYPMNINGFDPHNSGLKMSFYVWYRSLNKDFKPDTVEILNSADATITNTTTGENKEHDYFTTLHYQAGLDHHWDFRYFPFDHQVFKVVLEAANPTSSMILAPDYSQTNPNTTIHIDNWRFVKLKIESLNVFYNTNFGDSSDGAQEYSRIIFSYEYAHEGWRIFLNLFGAFFVCAIFCIMTNLFDDSDIRIQLILTAVIGFIGNKYIVDSIIPEVSEFTLSDAIQAATFATMLVALAGLLVERYLPEKYKKPINMMFAVVTSVCYVSYVSYQVYISVYPVAYL